MNKTPDIKKSVPDHPIYDVVIAGAGPVGLFLACELALRNCSVLVLEKAADPVSMLKQLPFGIRGLSAPSIEALYRRGLLDELEIHKRVKNPHMGAAQGSQRPVGHFAGIPFVEGNVDTTQWSDRLPSSPATSLISEMQELETIFARRAEALGVTIKRGIAITGFTQTTDGVTIQAKESPSDQNQDGPIAQSNDGPTIQTKDTPATQTNDAPTALPYDDPTPQSNDGQTNQVPVVSFQSKWLVGCDGSRSVVRKAGGFAFAGTEPEFTGYSAKVDILDPEKLKPGRNVTSTGMYLQSQPGYLNMQDFDGGAFHGSDEPITLHHVQEVLRKVSQTDVTLTALHIATTWTDRARQATTYRKGRVFLAGDAAHIHAPLGGQGLNLGLGDAMNLGWKLAATIHDQAPEDLLDSYYAERYPIGVQVLDWSRAQAAIMGTEPHARALYAIIRDLINTRDGATYFAGRVWGINTHYNLSSAQAVSGPQSSPHPTGDAQPNTDPHPMVGRSVPNFAFEDGSAIGEVLHDGKGILLDFSSNASLKGLAAEYGDQIKYISAKAKDQLGLSALLIRPDGYIAWAADQHPDLSEVKRSAERWFSKP